MPGLAKQLNVQTLQPAWQVECADAVSALAWDPQRDSLLVADMSGGIGRHDADGAALTQWPAHDGAVTRIAPNPRSGLLASAGEDGTAKLWLEGDAGRAETLAEEPAWMDHLVWSEDGSHLAAAAQQTIYLWREDGESAGVWFDASHRVLGMAWAPDGKRLASASNKGLYLWRLGGDEPMRLLSFPGAPVSLAWKPDGKALAVGTQDGFLQLWRQRTGKPASQLTMKGYPAKVSCLQWHPQKALLATAGGSDLVLWDLSGNGGGKPRPLRAHARTLTCVSYSPDGGLLVSGDREGRLICWGDKGEIRQELRLEAEITAAAWSQDGTCLAVGDASGQISVFLNRSLS